MTVDTAYKFVQFLARKNQTGSITPAEFEQAFNSSQRDLFNTLLGKITVAPHVALGNSERIAERLRPFKVTDEVKAVTGGNLVTYPDKFQALTVMVNATTNEAMQYLDDAKLRARLNSRIDPIADAKPAIFGVAAEGWRLYPNWITSVKVSYYELPDNVKWAYVEDNEGRPVYNPSTSVQPKWDDVSAEDILAKACTLLGFSFEKQTLIQYGQTQKAEGV